MDIHKRYAASDPRLADLFAREMLSFNKLRLWHRTLRYPDYVGRLDAYLFELSRTRWDRVKGWVRNRLGAERG
jgi:hypothetical protein